MTSALARLLALRVDLRDEAAAAEVRPEALAAYVERAGWTAPIETVVCRYYTCGDEEVAVPLRSDFRDYGRRVLEAVAKLARHEGRSLLAIWAELVELPAETVPPRAEVAPGRAGATPDAPEAAQALLPGFDEPPPERRGAQHRFGVLTWRAVALEPLAPGEVLAAVQACTHCGCLKRRANTGARLGAEDTYSSDGGETWSRESPPCIMKR